ncbi:quinone-dependent dihydroorotate dehydrogenase [Aquicella lusitana]|uniref:Dihydroorotate dehydrogenase (quinone) n=1 Tax=Aquicella lusitana TaxID=254246 RepID=A0A370GC93_9COXI|nr:quinone-dependent dihydroorotate dehydrogenase [Aquicella lusitana]RDI40074.1 dihydroorotate oxidase A [Aquicella lusitana]VVC72354.1 Dihydroorotate dehydrogenase (quinone) [Aquicella lusitana]
MYSLLRKALFTLDPERSHYIAMQGLQLAYQLRLLNRLPAIPPRPRTVMGLTFPHAAGLAAGLDKNADYVDALAALGFAFIEIGTVTPQPQAGNPRPRLFRLPEQEAIINRMGFNNKGVEYVARKLEQTAYRGILGINIGKNKDTPLENAADDYLFGFRHLWKFASYMTINISSPNTAGLRDLQQGDMLKALLGALKQEQQQIEKAHQKYVPLVVKISPDLSADALQALAQVLIEQRIDGVIATNTTLERQGVEQSAHAKETGGLSGKPLQSRSTETIRALHSMLQNRIPIIASGGIMDTASASEKLKAGASLLQVYTGFIYKGPAIIRQLATL